MGDRGDRFALNDTILDTRAGTLTRDGSLVPLRAKSFSLLMCLIGRAGQVVTKDDLFEAVWPGVFVTEDSLTQAVRDVRTALGDTDGKLIRSIRGRGYLLDLPSSATRPQVAQQTELPRIAVLPFSIRPQNDEMASRIDGLLEDIAAGLTQFPTLRVISTGSTRQVLEEVSDPEQVAERLRATYLINGAALLSPSGLKLRISVTRTGSFQQVWSETFESAEAEILTTWDRIVARVIGHLVNALEIEAPARSSFRSTESLTAYDHRARGLALWTSDDPDVAERSLVHFRAAIEADPNFALAWTHMAWAELAMHECSMAPPEVQERTLGYSRRAVELAPFDGRTHSGLGYNQALCGQFADAEANVLFGKQLAPSSVDCMFDHAIVVMLRGRPLETIRILDEAADLCPIRISYDAHLRGEALFMVGRYSEAADCFLRMPRMTNRRRLFLAAILAKAGRTTECIAQVEVVMRASPDEDHIDIMRRGYLYEHASDAEHLLDAARLALDLWREARSNDQTAA